MTETNIISREVWPSLPLDKWNDTYATLHLWTQVVGKIRLAQTPWTNHSWHVTLYVTPRGLTTGSVPYGARAFQIDFDFIAHELKIHSDRSSTAVGRRFLPASQRRNEKARSRGEDLPQT
jgi:hypothetical protein